MDLLENLAKFNDMVLATSYQDKVTARTVSTILYNNKIYFQTANDMEKYEQIKNNKNVALTKGFYQIEGHAKSIGRWEEVPQLSELYKTKHRSSYENYGNLKQEEVIEVTITNIKLWSYEDNDVFIIHYDPQTDTINKELQTKN